MKLLGAAIISSVLAHGSPLLAQAEHAGEHAEPSLPAQRSGPLALGEIGRRIASASDGDTVEIPAGVYREHIRIDKPLTLIARGRVVIDGESSGDIVEITAPDVNFIGFTVRNTGIDLDLENAAIRALAPRVRIEGNTLEDVLFGIDLRDAESSVIRGNTVGSKDLDIARRGDGLRLWRSDRTIIEDNIVRHGRDAIIWYSTGVTVRRNRCHDSRYGLHLMFSDDVTIEDNDFRGNSVGVYLMYSTGVEIRRNVFIRNRGPSGYGIGLKETDRFSVVDNVLAQNRVGVYIDGSPFTSAKPGLFTRNTIAYNDAGFTILPSARGNEIVGNNLIDNIEQVRVAGRGTLDANKFWSGDRGNFWSDYTGYDENGDGVGEFVHEPHSLFDNLMEKEPSLRLFLFSPAQQAIEFVGRALPAMRPEPAFVDEVPLMRPVSTAFAPGASAASRAAMGALGAAMAAIGCAAVGIARRTDSPRERKAQPRSATQRGSVT